jgi:hypothetical protein
MIWDLLLVLLVIRARSTDFYRHRCPTTDLQVEM